MGLKSALISNGRSPFQERNFNALGIAHLFDAVVISESVGLRKPDKAIFKLTCDLLDIKTSDAVFVGDSIKSDIRGANNAGMYSVFLSSSSDQNCKEANAVLLDYCELQQIILNAN